MMNLQQKVRFVLIAVFFAWGTSLGIRYQAAWDALGLYTIGFIMMKYGKG